MSRASPVNPEDPLFELVPGVVAGEGEAIEAFLRAVLPKVVRVVRQVLGVHHPDVPDVVQESSYAIIESLERFRGDSSVSHFISRVAALTAMNTLRKCLVRERFAAECADLDALGHADGSPFVLVVAAKRRDAFRRLLEELPAPQADALTMHCVLGLTVEEAAQASGVPVNTLRGRLVTARASLRKKLVDDPELCELLAGVS